jgi:hypothetical protein
MVRSDPAEDRPSVRFRTASVRSGAKKATLSVEFRAVDRGIPSTGSVNAILFEFRAVIGRPTDQWQMVGSARRILAILSASFRTESRSDRSGAAAAEKAILSVDFRAVDRSIPSAGSVNAKPSVEFRAFISRPTGQWQMVVSDRRELAILSTSYRTASLRSGAANKAILSVSVEFRAVNRGIPSAGRGVNRDRPSARSVNTTSAKSGATAARVRKYYQ